MTAIIHLFVDRFIFRFTLLLISRWALLIKLRATLVLIPAIRHLSIPALSNRFSHFRRKFFSSSINIAVVLSDLLGFTLVFVDSLTFGIRDCFALLLVRLQREFQMPTIWKEYANNSLSSWTASAKNWLTCEQTSSSTVLHESWNENF